MRALAIGTALYAAIVASAQASAAEPEIRYTSYGVPHVKADNFRDLGRGLGQAFARDNVCLFAEKIVTIRGERARFFGAEKSYVDLFAGFGGAEINNLSSDFYHRFMFTTERARFMQRGSGRDLMELNRGFVAGYNAWLAKTGASGLPESCRNAAWVRPITIDDLLLRHHQIALIGTSNFVLPNLVAATPPGKALSEASRNALAAAADPTRLTDARGQGSNALALGGEATADGRGLLIGNPHFPWAGTERLYQMHLTVPGKLDVYGGGAYGQTLPFVGFNRDVAWSTTWSTDQRGVFYRLDLDPADPTTFVIDGKKQKMVPVNVSVDVGDGKARTHQFWRTPLGPVLGGGPYFPWTKTNAIVIHDANIGNNRWLEQFMAMARAQSSRGLLAELKRIQGNPINNTIAADRNGDALYTDMGIAVAIPDKALGECIDTPEAKAVLDTFYLMLLNGSKSVCHPRMETGSVQPGIVPPSERPVLLRRDYVLHANDSHWIVNADPGARLSGFARVIGDETLPRNERTRAGMAIVADRLAGRDGLPGNRFDGDNLERLFFAGRFLHAEQTVDDVLASCRADPKATATDGAPIDLAPACDVLARWDRKVSVTSVGVPIFREFLARLPFIEVVGLVLQTDQYKVAFNPADPVQTPRGLTMTAANRRALADAVQYLAANGIPLDAPLGKVQFAVRDGVRLPLGGDPSTFHNIRAELIKGEGYANVLYGDSYIQIVGFDAKGPRARAVTTYSQSTDPASPQFADMTRRFSEASLFDVPFSDEAIKADPGYRVEALLPEVK